VKNEEANKELVTILAIVVVLSLIIVLAAFVALNANASIQGKSFFDILKKIFIAPEEKVKTESPIINEPGEPLPPELPEYRKTDPSKPLV